MKAPVFLLVCDGWGHAPASPGNAITRARTPIFDRWLADHPWTLLEASGEAVGLPAGVMGNSEVGHLTLGAGRMVPQDLLRIDLALRDGSFFDNPALLEACAAAKRKGATLHLMGLVSDGGVHSDWEHLMALLDMSQQFATPKIALHVFTDGRDVGPTTGLGYMTRLEQKVAGLKGVRIATVTGRYYAMDRDKRWDRVEKAYNAIVCGTANYRAASAVAAVQAAYDRGETDEFIQATVISSEDGQPVAPERICDKLYVAIDPSAGLLGQGPDIGIRMFNQSGHKVFMAIYIDGINMINQQRELPIMTPTERHWSVRDGYDAVLRNWYHIDRAQGLSQQSKFHLVDAPQAVAVQRGLPAGGENLVAFGDRIDASSDMAKRSSTSAIG